MADEIEALSESAKAVQEVAKLGGKTIDASRKLGGWLDRVFGNAIEDAVGLHWSDRIKIRRVERAIYDWERLQILMHKVAANLHAKGIDTTRIVPPKIALPLIENATIEYDDDLHTLWANLLANALNPSVDEIEIKFISTLSELTTRDAQVLKVLCLEWEQTDKQKLFEDSTLKYGPGVDGGASHDAVSIITLNRLGLIAPAFIEFETYEPPGHSRFGDYGPTRDPVRAYGDLEVVTVTPFGEAFYKAVAS